MKRKSNFPNGLPNGRPYGLPKRWQKSVRAASVLGGFWESVWEAFAAILLGNANAIANANENKDKNVIGNS